MYGNSPGGTNLDIKTAKLGDKVNQKVYYTWVDTEGDQVSRIYNDFGQAISYLTGWKSAHMKIMRMMHLYINRYSSDENDIVEQYDKFSKLSKNGNIPYQLLRLEVQTYVAELSDAEHNLVREKLKDVDLPEIKSFDALIEEIKE